MTKTHTPICYIISAGDIYRHKIHPQPADLVIGVDGGCDHLRTQNITPDIVIGDFDSIQGKLPKSKETITLPQSKDDSDTLAALKLGINKGYKTFFMYGCSGGKRFDHTFANIQCLVLLAQKGIRGYMFTKHEIITAIHSGLLHYSNKCKGYISVFAYDNQTKGVTITGLKYPLNNSKLENNFPKGLSNEFIGRDAVISVESGTLLIFCKHLPLTDKEFTANTYRQNINSK